MAKRMGLSVVWISILVGSTQSSASLGGRSFLLGLRTGLEGETGSSHLGLALSAGLLGGLTSLLDLSEGGFTGSLALLGLLGALLLDSGQRDTSDGALDLGDLTDLLADDQVLLGLVHLTVDSSPAELGGLVLVQEQTTALGVAEEEDSVIRAHIADTMSSVHLIGGE